MALMSATGPAADGPPVVVASSAPRRLEKPEPALTPPLLPARRVVAAWVRTGSWILMAAILHPYGCQMMNALQGRTWHGISMDSSEIEENDVRQGKICRISTAPSSNG